MYFCSVFVKIWFGKSTDNLYAHCIINMCKCSEVCVTRVLPSYETSHYRKSRSKDTKIAQNRI